LFVEAKNRKPTKNGEMENPKEDTNKRKMEERRLPTLCNQGQQ
jgi:hypothetical protein